jgi:single-strand DNA-binding protein
MQMNSITLVGRAASDPEVRYYESGSVRATFTLLVNRRSSQDAPDAFPLELWGKQAQAAADTVRKGALVGIIGSVHRGYGDPVDESQFYIRVDRLELLGKPQEVVA